MKKNYHAFIYTIAALFCCIVLISGCGGKSSSQNDDKKNDQKEAIGALIREDAEGLVRVIIADGLGEMTLDLDKWDSLYKIFNNFDKEEFTNGPFRIITQQDSAILDAWVGRIRNLNIYSSNYPSLYVVLIMENGSLERAPVWPYRMSVEEDLSTWGPLPWIADITAISGRDNTVYAEAANGNKYDISIPVAIPDIGKKYWETRFDAGSEVDYYGEINFLSENGVSYVIRSDANSAIYYSGYYEMILHDSHSGDLPANTLQLFLSLESEEGEINSLMKAMPLDMEAAYSIEMNQYGDTLTLRRLRGNDLFNNNSFNREVYEFSSPGGGESTIYPWELTEIITGSWKCFLEGYYDCNLNIYYSNFNQYTRDFTITFMDNSRGVEFREFKGGIYSGMDYTYGEFNTITLVFYIYDRESETYLILDRGIHRGKRMLSLFPNNPEDSVFSLMDLSEKYGYAHVPLLFARDTDEQREGRKRVNAAFNAIFWEYDRAANTIWLTEAGLGGGEPSCVSVEYKVSGIEDWAILEALPGMDCMIKTNTAGEVVEFILPMG